jgi:uncharacterized Fe-S radical SAM superfamily protein PflX
MEARMRSRRSSNSGLVDLASVKRNLGRLYESNLFERIVEYFELLHGQVSIYFNDDPFHSDAGGRGSGRVDHVLRVRTSG